MLSIYHFLLVYLYILYTDRACLCLMYLVNWKQHQERKLMNELILQVMLNYW